MNNSTSFTQSNTGGVNFQNQISGGQVNQAGDNITVNNDGVPSVSANQEEESKARKTILFLAANPSDTSRLRVDVEHREIDESLRRSNMRDQFQLENKGAVRIKDFYRAILDAKPYIIHFSGHGAGEEGLALENDQGQAEFLSTELMDGYFELFAKDGVACVLLNACYSETQAKVIQKHIPYVIGMNQSIPDKAAIEFAVTFYDAIGADRDVEYAFKLAKGQLIRFGKQSIPQLLKQAA